MPDKKHKCPECGQSKRSAAGLGAHRRKMHGVKGKEKSKPTRKKKEPRKRETRQPAVLPQAISDEMPTAVRETVVELETKRKALLQEAGEVEELIGRLKRVFR